MADGIRLRDNSAITVGAYAELALPARPAGGSRAGGGRDPHGPRGLQTDADDVRDNLRRVKRVVSGVSDQLIVDERVAETM